MEKSDKMEENPAGITKIGSDKWVDAHYDPFASLYTFTQCITLSDVNADGDCKLIIADLGPKANSVKLKVYKGTSCVSENTILDLPTGVVTFYMDTTEPHTPAIAVASGPYIYVYKNLRPYFKFTLPVLDVDLAEVEAWNQLKTGKLNSGSLVEALDNLKVKGVSLTVQSLKLLDQPATNRTEFINLYQDTPLKKQTVITCLGTMKKSLDEVTAINCLILGAENRQIYVLDPEAFTVLAVMLLPSVPVFLDILGLFDVEFTILVACRNGGIYGLKRGSKTGRQLLKLTAQPVGLHRLQKHKMILVACMDETLRSYTMKGKHLWTVKMPAAVMTTELLDYTQKGVQAMLVALANNEVHAYIDKHLVDVIKTEDVVTGMRCGRFGREEVTLIMTTRGGGLIVKMLKRTAHFDDRVSRAGPPAAQSIKLNVPKKTKLFLDQTIRERENGPDMYRQFQADLYRMRLETARKYVGVLTTSMTPISESQAEPIRLQAEVTGLGPVFKMAINVQNTSINQPSKDLYISFDYDSNLYSIDQSLIDLPMLVPGIEYVFDTLVQCLSDKGLADNIKAFVLKKASSVPIITAVINMPVSESVVVV